MGFVLTEQIERHLQEDQIAWMTTVTPSGRPAPRVVWFIWNGEAIVVYCLNDSAKLRHLRSNHDVTVSFNCSRDGTDVVVIGGRAEFLPDAPPPSQYPGLLDKYAARIERMGRHPDWYDRDYAVAVRVVPERAWTIPR